MSLFKKSCQYLLLPIVVTAAWNIRAETPSSAIYSKSQLQQRAVEFVQDKLPPLQAGERELSALPLDDRIPDRSCSGALEMQMPDASVYNRQITVQVKCNQEKNYWTQYVHIRIHELSPVVIAVNNLAKGELIKDSDLAVVMKPKSLVRVQYLDDPGLLVGSRSKRSLRQGMPVRQDQVCMVCKGDKVNILATYGGLTIKTTGEALEDGTLGEQIEVKNSRSGKHVSARVTDVETVAVNI